VITANLVAAGCVPERLQDPADGMPHSETVELRGEVYLPLDTFERLNRERVAAGRAPYATPRNLAAGSARLGDPREAATRGLQAVFFGWGTWQPAATAPVSQQAFRDRARAWGLAVPEPAWTARGADDLVDAVRALEAQRARWRFPVDGLVVKLDAAADRQQLGSGAGAPRWAVAWKFAPARVETRLRGITLQRGAKGALTPVAELEPVMLKGRRVSRATLHNAAFVARGDYRVGDTVIVEMAGDVIPSIVGINLALRPQEARPYDFDAAASASQQPAGLEGGELEVPARPGGQ